jgi:hypothetical protein
VDDGKALFSTIAIHCSALLLKTLEKFSSTNYKEDNIYTADALVEATQWYVCCFKVRRLNAEYLEYGRQFICLLTTNSVAIYETSLYPIRHYDNELHLV